MLSLKNTLKGVVIAGLVLNMGVAQAERTVKTAVTAVFANANGNSFVKLASNRDTTNSVCSANSRYTVSAGGAGAKNLLAALLTAKASGSKVQLDVDCASTEVANVIVY